MRDSDSNTPLPIPSLPSSYSVHDFHNFNFQVWLRSENRIYINKFILFAI